jgi:hypothetical protein
VGSVFSGFVCGYALGLLATPAVAIAMLRARTSSGTLRRLVPEGASLVAVSIIIHVFAILTLTAIGIVFGIMLAGLESNHPSGGLGSPNATFTLFVIVVVTIAVLPIGVAVPRWRLALLLCGLVFVATFGWAMPYLSLIANSKS